MNKVDLTPFLTALIGIATAALGVFGSWALAALAKKLGVQTSQQQQDMFDAALHKLIAYGATQSMELIRARGWDHADVHSAIIATALNAAMEKFPDAVRATGLDPSSPEFMTRLREALERVYPTAMTPIAASPATPPAPVLALDAATHEVKV